MHIVTSGHDIRNDMHVMQTEDDVCTLDQPLIVRLIDGRRATRF